LGSEHFAFSFDGFINAIYLWAFGTGFLARGMLGLFGARGVFLFVILRLFRSIHCFLAP
jgi:hypothetical protein